MAITGIGYGTSYRDYFAGTDTLSTDIAKTGSTVAANEMRNGSAADGDLQSDAGDGSRPSEKIENLVFDFKKNNNFNLIGASNEIEDVDVDKALSEMQKDSVLSQYKFFVRPNMGTDSDGTVRQVIRGL